MPAKSGTKTFPERSLRDLYYVIFRQKRKILACFLGVLALTFAVTFLLPKSYQSDAQLLVRVGRESVSLDPTATTGQVVNVGQLRENEIRSEMEILRSQALAEAVVEAVGPGAVLRSQSSFGQKAALADSPEESSWQREKAVRSFMEQLKIDTQRNSNIISLAYQAKSPDTAQTVLDKLINLYLDKHISVHRTPGSDEFFAKETEVLRSRLQESEKALRDLKNQTGVASVDEQRRILLNRIGTTKRTLEEAEASIAASASRLGAMQQTLATLPNALIRTRMTGYSGNPIDYLQQRLHDLQLREQDLLSNFTEKYHVVKEVRRQIAEAEEMLKKQGATHRQVSQLALLTEKAALSEAEARAKVLKQDLAAAQEELTRLNDSEFKIAGVERDLGILRANYRNYSDKLEQARIDRSLDTVKISNISIVQPATFPVKPVRPRPALNLAIGLFLGMFGSLALAFVADRADHSFRTPDEVTKRLGVPVLATLPQYEDISRYLDFSAAPALNFYPVGNGGKANHEVQRCYEDLPNQLLNASASVHGKSSLLALTSCYQREGTSLVACNLAAKIAYHQCGRVLLIDANPNRPSVHAVFGLPQAPGLAELLRQNQYDSNLVHALPIKNLDVLTAGDGQTPPRFLYDSRSFAEALTLWRHEYDFIIFDTPPLYEGNSTLHLANGFDGLILVVEAQRIRWEVVQQAAQMVAQAKGNLLGVVLNKRQFPIPDWLYRTL